MNTTTRFTTMIKKMVLPLVACGMMCATGAYAQAGDIIGFYSPSPNQTFTSPGVTVEFTMRLYGTVVVSNLFNTMYAQPKIRMEVGSEGVLAYATLIRSAWTQAPFSMFNRTDLTFAYTIRPGDMADPLKIYAPTSGFIIDPAQCWIYKAYTNGVWSNVTWKVNNLLVNQPGNNNMDSPFPIEQAAIDLSEQKITIKTLSFDALNCPSPLIARQPATLWRIKTEATNATAVKVVVWTPHTNVLQIVGSAQVGSVPGDALEVTIPAGSSYVDFPIKGLDTNAIPTIATVYAQRPSDYAKNVTAITNFITRAVTIAPPGAPTISIEFPNGQASTTLSETNDVDTGSFQILLSEPHTNRVYIDFNLTYSPTTATNIVITQPSGGGGFYVEAGQERSQPYFFSVTDGTRESLSTRARLTPFATNTTMYTTSAPGLLTLVNIAPTIQWYVPPTGDEEMPVTFEWFDLIDVDADINSGIVFRWNFGDGSPITVTNTAKQGTILHTYYNIGAVPKDYPVSLTITDKDRGTYTLTQVIRISPAPKPPFISVVVNRAVPNFQESETTAEYQVVLSEAARQNTFIEVKGQYMIDGTSSDDCLTLSMTNNIIIPVGQTNSMPFTMAFKDGTVKTAMGIYIIPSITNTAAQTQYSGSPVNGYLRILNVAPAIDTVPTSQPISPSTAPVAAYAAIEMSKPFVFRYRATDIVADVNGTPPISVQFQFENEPTITSVGNQASVTNTFTRTGLQTVTMVATDKDGGVRTVTFPIMVVVPLPPPSVTVVNYPVFIAENDTTAKQLTVMLSQTPASAGLTQPVVVNLTVTPPGPVNPGAITVPASVTFYASESTKQVIFTVQDGTRLSASAGFTVTPSIVTNTPGDTVYTQFQPGQILVQNVAPVFQQPVDGSTNTVATVGQPRTFTWSVRDVAADLPGMTIFWDWGDGTTTTTTGASGTTNHIYNTASPQVSVTVTATDKDGDYNTISFYVTVKDSKQIIALPIGPNTAGFNGYTDLGTGTIIAPAAATLPNPWNAAERFYTFLFSADALTAQLRAIPTPGPLLSGKHSYFFAWDGPLAAFQNPLHVTKPLAPALTVIVMPTGTVGAGAGTGAGTALNGNMVQVSAIFTVEYSEFDVENPPGVNNGDLNQDGIPDRLVQRYFIDPAQAGGTDTALDPIWFVNLSMFNDDNDFLPVYPTGDNQGVMDFRPVANPNTAQGGVAVNAFTAFMEIRGYDGILGTDDDPLTDPTLDDTDGDGYPDGWEYWFWYQSDVNRRTGSRYNPLNIAQGYTIGYAEITEAFSPIRPRSAYNNARWRDDFDNDGLLDIEELVLGTDPTNWDTDGDIMADGWEIIRGFNPCDGRDGNLLAQNNPDGDYFAISTVARQHIQVVVTNAVGRQVGDRVFLVETNHYLVALDAGGARSNGTLTTAYRYGDDTAPWAVGRPVANAVLTPDNLISSTNENVTALILHFQVRMENGFDPRVAWCLALPRFAAAYVSEGAPLNWALLYGPAERFGPWLPPPPPPHAPTTRPFTAVDEYLLMKFMYELQMNGMIGPNGWIGRVNAAVGTRILVQEGWARFTTHPRTPDTDATPGLSDGVPDGWELYVAVAENRADWLPNNAFVYSPWSAADGTGNRPDDGVSYQEEYWGTDSIPFYLNAALYYGGMDPTVIPATGTTAVTIQRPAGHADTYWVNKFWPTDPWSTDTDDDNVSDGGERAFVYGNAAVAGGVCIAGGGLNPNSADTDRDALPDAWETQFAGAPVAANGATTLPPVLPGQPAIAVAMTITDGQDGTVADAINKDSDYDGLVSYQEYMTQALRGYRYDVPDGAVPNDVTVVDPFTGNIGQPMDITFEIGAFFTPVTMAWDQSRLGWPGPADILWYMRPAGPNGYCSTDPQNPDSDYDNMDDYYELYHGLNPLLGRGIRADYLDDRVAYAWLTPAGPIVWYSFNWWMMVQPGTVGFSMDFNLYPWLNGMPTADPDADGLLNLEEMLAVNMPLPENQNTDPSPIWMTDPSNVDSMTARFYTPYGYTGDKVALNPLYRPMFFWPSTILPWFTFQFEMNEGYDTDNDGVSDKDEMVTNRGPLSDPRDSEDPIRRQAIWFSGTNSAATTPYMYTDLNTVVGQSFADMEQAFRSFTVELWARPEWATNRNEQILIERAFDYQQSDASQVAGEPRLRRNFIIGIAPDGRVFGGFDNAGGHDAHTDSVRLYGEKIVSNTWVHLAARMDGRNQRFNLFVNGVSQGEMSTTLIPATGLDPARYYPTETPETIIPPPRPGTLIIGAANIEMVSLGIGIGWELPLYYYAMTWDASWLTGYEKFYRGWIDEVRVWDGARSNQEINDNFRKRFTRDDLLANRTMILEQLNNGAARNALSTNNFLSPILMNYYTFNNLFSAHEERYVAQVPRGFNTAAVNANRPYGNAQGAMVNWWDQCEVKNTVYNNWHYLPWIENVAAHMPRVTQLTNTNGPATFVNDNSVSDSIYWTRRSAGNLEAQNSFPNNNNPYGFNYNTTQAIDLLPIGDAWAKQCVDFWDDKGASGNWLENSNPDYGGTTDDGLPTWWTRLHGTAGGWNDLYTGIDPYYRENGMTNGEVYQRDLAKGLLPSAALTNDYNVAYAQTADSNGDGMPDWWKRIYGLSIMDKTGQSGTVGDPDKDGLSNYAEYLITEVYGFRYSNPLKFKTNPAQPVSDYFMKPDFGGKLILGAMFSDHDFIEDWWEEMYSPTAANPFVYDSKTDYDWDGWSNWAEARYSQAISTARPDLRERVMVNGITTFEYPIPIVDTRLNYKGVQASGDVVIQAFSDPLMNGTADATWNIAFGQNVIQPNTIPLGFYANKTIRTRLSPGSVVPGTIHIQLTDTWTGMTDITAFDMDGVIYSMDTAGVWEPIGTIIYITGEMVLDMGSFENVRIILDAATFPADRNSYLDSALSYFEMVYDTKLPNGWPQHIYLGRAATGALKEGKNYFFAFIDVDGNGLWDAGEPAGIPTPFETDIGWDENELAIQLTDYTPYNLRLSLTTGLRSEDVIFGTGGNQPGGGGGQQQPTAGYKRVRIIRTAVQTSNYSEGPIFDKTIFGRDYIHEGDLMTMPVYAGYGLDWGFKGIQVPTAVGAVTYKVYVGDQDTVTNNTLVATFTNKFDGARSVPATILPAHGAYVYTARPTFTWAVSTNNGYNAFAFELRRNSKTGPLVYPVTTRQAPLEDTQTGNYVWEAPFYMGDNTNVVNNAVYYWRVQLLNPRYSTLNAVDAEWSSWKLFRWDVNQPLPPAGGNNGSSSGYGQLRAVVKYFGPVTNLTEHVVLQAFNNRGFTGLPAAQYMYKANKITSITNTSLSATNAISMRGLKPDTYYVRAFIDSNTNSVLDAWESWGYANYYGENKSLYDVRPVDVSFSGISPLVTVYIEDADTDQDWFPDAYEYQESGNMTFGPGSTNETWRAGDTEINPNLNTNEISYIGMRLAVSRGQQDAFFRMAVDPASLTPAIPPAVTIQNLSFIEVSPKLDFEVTAGTPAQSTSAFVKFLLGTSGTLSDPAVRTYTYRVRFSESLEAPRPWLTIVKEETITVDANGTRTIMSVIDSMPAAGTRGFFYVEVE